MVHKNPFARLFGRSPIQPLQDHMALVLECVSELIPFFDAVTSSDWTRAEQVQARISDKESEADRVKKQLRLQLPKGLMLPVSRRDLLEVLTMQDKVANRAKDIAGLMLGRHMEPPGELGPLFLEFVQRCVDATAQARKAINEMDELLETGFRGGEAKLVRSLILELDRVEGDTDRIQIRVRAALFAIERDLPPVDVIFLYRIIDWIGDLADRAQRVGSRLELMLAR